MSSTPSIFRLLQTLCILLTMIGMFGVSAHQRFEECCLEMEEQEVEELISRFSRRKEDSRLKKAARAKFFSPPRSCSSPVRKELPSSRERLERRNLNGIGAYLVL